MGGAEAGTVGHVVVGGEQQLGDAEVEDLRPTPGRQDHVVGLEVAVDDAPAMSLGEARGDVASDVEGLGDAELAGLHPLVQGLARHQLHDDVVVTVLLQELVDLDDGGVLEAGDGACLAAQPRTLDGVLVVGRDPFDGDRPVELLVVTAIDLAHAAGSEAAVDPVGADACRQQVGQLEAGRGADLGR